MSEAAAGSFSHARAAPVAGLPVDRSTPLEHRVDAVVHVLGITLCAVGVTLMMLAAQRHLEGPLVVALAVYGVALMLLFCASAAYHLTRTPALKARLRRFDQAAIFLKIAGTYTPLTVLTGGLFAQGLLAAIWLLAGAGAVLRLTLAREPSARLTLSIYLTLGWASLLLFWPMSEALRVGVIALVVAGGVLYTIGAALFYRTGLRFQRAIWHAFVLAASICHFAAISMASFA